MIKQIKMRTPIGVLLIRADDNSIVEINFSDQEIISSSNQVLEQACSELNEYFEGKRSSFTVPIKVEGTQFQVNCWEELMKIPYAETISYKDQAIKIKNKNYCRAVAGANNKNKIPIIIPCHRVIGNDGSLVGYAGGLNVKEYLINLEKNAEIERSRH